MKIHVIIGLIAMLTFSYCNLDNSNKQPETTSQIQNIENNKPKKKVIGFNGLSKYMIGSGSMGAIAGIVHGWKEKNWELVAKYICESGRIGDFNQEVSYLKSSLNDYQLIGFDLGELIRNSPYNFEYKSCEWTFTSPNNDTINLYTDEILYAEKGNQSEWCTYFKPNNYIK